MKASVNSTSSNRRRPSFRVKEKASTVSSAMTPATGAAPQGRRPKTQPVSPPARGLRRGRTRGRKRVHHLFWGYVVESAAYRRERTQRRRSLLMMPFVAWDCGAKQRAIRFCKCTTTGRSSVIVCVGGASWCALTSYQCTPILAHRHSDQPHAIWLPVRIFVAWYSAACQPPQHGGGARGRLETPVSRRRNDRGLD